MSMSEAGLFNPAFLFPYGSAVIKNTHYQV